MPRTTVGLLITLILSLRIAPLAAEVPLAGSQYGVSEPSTPDLIRPGVPWYDTRGERISAHGGGILKVDDRYYWFGTYMDSLPQNQLMGWGATHQFVAITCYSSKDLVRWTPEGQQSVVLAQQVDGDLGPGRVVERPKVVFNEKTSKYVMYLHIDNALYTESKVGVAESAHVAGPYTYRGSFNPDGRPSADLTVFKDDDGEAYLVSSNGGNPVDGYNIYRLSDDYLSVRELVTTVEKWSAEAPALLKRDGTYYLFGSRITSWEANDNFYLTAPRLEGPWTFRGDFTPDSDNTFNAQTTFVLPIDGKAMHIVFMADRWNRDFVKSTYIWLPGRVDGPSTHVDWTDAWSLDSGKAD
jgi:hypothetical protein